MGDLILGWDVGGWNCDRNQSSRDALCALVIRESKPAIVGEAWRGNLRELLVTQQGRRVVEEMVKLLVIDAEEQHVTIAIDTPLAWPRSMIQLVTTGTRTSVPQEADRNPYLFRAQERALFGADRRPLSSVRDMIGSQSTKGIHFLNQAELSPEGIGVWVAEGVSAIETYPAAVRDEEIIALRDELLREALSREKPRSEVWRSDVRDAITCALVGWLHRQAPQQLEGPDETASGAEGWIWLPRTD